MTLLPWLSFPRSGEGERLDGEVQMGGWKVALVSWSAVPVFQGHCED